MTAGRLERVGPEAFDVVRLKRPGRVAVAFLADWCPFCRLFEPEFARVAGSGVASLLVADVTDEESPLWDLFAIRIVPTVVVFDSGSPVFRADGVPGEGLGAPDLAAIRDALAGIPRAGPGGPDPRVE